MTEPTKQQHQTAREKNNYFCIQREELGGIFASLNWEDVLTTFTCDIKLWAWGIT